MLLDSVKEAIAKVAKPGDDIFLLVEAVIKDGEAEICLWVSGVNGLFSFGGADHADDGDM